MRAVHALLLMAGCLSVTTPAWAQYGCTTAACQSAMASLSRFDAENPSTSTTGELKSSSTILCMKAVRQMMQGGLADYTADWRALYDANRSKGMTVKQAKDRVLAQWYGKFIQGVARRQQFCETGIKNTKISS